MEDYKYKLSIIIPLYNAEKYIQACLDSLLESDLPKNCYEIVIVNDGSKDKGPEIVKSYLENHSNISYYTQENQGQSVARNYGIKVAKGEYIWFVDSDDKVETHLITIYQKLIDHPSLDILNFKLRYVTETGNTLTIVWNQPVPYSKVITGSEAIISGYQPSSVCVLFINRNLLINNNLFFVPGITHQDSELSYRLYAHADKVLFENDVPYIYIKHEDSTIMSKNPQKVKKRILDDIVIAKSFRQLAKEFKNSNNPMSRKIQNQSDDLLFSIVYNLFRNKKNYKNNQISDNVLETLKKEKLYPITCHYNSLIKNLCKHLLNIEFFIH